MFAFSLLVRKREREKRIEESPKLEIGGNNTRHVLEPFSFLGKIYELEESIRGRKSLYFALFPHS